MTEPVHRRGRGGRPRSPSPRLRQVSVRLTEEERAHLAAVAGAGGAAAWLRAALTGQRPPVARQVPQVNAEAWRALAPALANLNQLARAANAGQLPGGLAPLLAEVRDHVAGLRLALLGAAPAEGGP